MLPTLNGKPLTECLIEDFQGILDNSDYKENEQLDYKTNFSILDYDKTQKQKSSEVMFAR